jgi:hypothetical protein
MILRNLFFYLLQFLFEVNLLPRWHGTEGGEAVQRKETKESKYYPSACDMLANLLRYPT